MFQLLVLFITLSLGSVAIADPSQSTGEDGFQRCAACHLPGGEGIPGAFPPLKGRIASIASSDEGRAYLVAVVNVGLMGSITVNGMPYMGVMPAQGSNYDAGGISELLNYSVQVIDKENASTDWKPFSAAEVESILESGSAINSQGTARLREALLAQHPELR